MVLVRQYKYRGRHSGSIARTPTHSSARNSRNNKNRGRFRATIKNAAIEAAMIAQSYRENHGRRLLLPKFSGKRKSRKGRLYKSTRLQGRGAENPFIRFSETSRALNIANKATPVLPFTQPVTGTEILTTLVAVDDLYRVIFDKAINPADPSIFPRTSATVLQYQNYRVDAMTIRYVPSVATAVNGSVLFGIVPDPASEAPTDVEQFQNLGGSVYDQVFGKTLSLPISGNMMNTAYNKLTVRKPATDADADPLYSVGRIFCAQSGVDTGVGNNIVLGTIYLDFAFQVMNPRITTNANGFDGVHATSKAASSTVVPIPEDDELVSGHSAFVSTGTAGVMAFRMNHVPHVVVLHATAGVAANAWAFECRYTNSLADYATGTALSADWSVSNTSKADAAAQFTVPGGYRYAYFTLTNAATLPAVHVYCATRSR